MLSYFILSILFIRDFTHRHSLDSYAILGGHERNLVVVFYVDSLYALLLVLSSGQEFPHCLEALVQYAHHDHQQHTTKQCYINTQQRSQRLGGVVLRRNSPPGV